MSTLQKPVTIRRTSTLPRSSWRLVPASFASLAFHGLLFAVLVLLSSSGQAEIVTEPAVQQTIIGTDTQTYEPDRNDPFLSSVVNEGSLERDANPNFDNPVRGEVSIPGKSDPLDKAGLNDGALEGILRDLGPQIGLAKDPTGLSGAIDGKDGTLESLRGPGGVLYGGTSPDYFKILRGSATSREQLLRQGGGTDASEAAVTRGLQWLARNQSPNGSWRLDGNFQDKGTQNDIAGTAFGLLPFLAAGKTHKAAKNNPYDKPIDNGLKYLIGKQDKRSGNLGGGMYGHALAAIALSEAYGITQDPVLRRPAQLAANFIVNSQHNVGGWRYAPNQAGDTSVTGWHIMALKSAQMAGLDVSEVALRKAMRYLDGCCDPNNEGYGYTGMGSTPTMSSVGLLCRQYLQGWGPQNIRLIKSIDNNVKPTMANGPTRNIYFYYYATQVMYHFGGDAWKNWNQKMRDFLVQTQEADNKSANFGSWSSAGDPQGSAGGRLMITSLNLLTLEVYYRHLPLYYREVKKG